VWATLWPPLSLAVIGAVLERDGHQVRIMDCPAAGWTFDDVKRTIDEINPGAIIWSTGTPSIESDLQLASLVKSWRPAASTVVFGTHVTALDRECLQSAPGLDIVVRNEPEATVAVVVNTLSEGQDIGGIAGITYRNEQGAILRNPERPFIENLNELPFPAWHLIDVDRYRLPLKGRPFLMVAPLRGCPFQCSFCTCHTYYGARLRTRSVESVLAEIAHDRERFGVSDFFFWAETFVVNKNYVRELCRAMLERGVRIAWTANSRVDTVDADLLSLMARAGCWMLSFGIESASQAVLDQADKGTHVSDAMTAVQLARRVGIKTVGHFILGLPGETEESLEATIAYAANLRLDLAQFYCAVPFPGSRLYEHALKEKWINPPDFSNFNQNTPLLNLPGLPAEVVSGYRARAYRRFYTRPANVIRALRLVNWSDIGGLFRSLAAFVRWMLKL
jgi:radical SAM superfamily enzyme YgiQ (UPF0313 family)